MLKLVKKKAPYFYRAKEKGLQMRGKDLPEMEFGI